MEGLKGIALSAPVSANLFGASLRSREAVFATQELDQRSYGPATAGGYPRQCDRSMDGCTEDDMRSSKEEPCLVAYLREFQIPSNTLHHH